MSDRHPLRFAVVLQTPRDPHSAVFISYQSLRRALEAIGHTVEIVSPADLPGMRRLGGRWVPLGFPFAVAWWRWRRRAAFDLVIFHSYAGWLATALGRREPRSVVMFHGVEPLYHRELREEAAAGGRPLSWRYRALQEIVMPFMLRTGCRSADAVACLNRAEADFLEARRWRRDTPARVLAHGVPAAFFAPPRAARPLRSLLFVGQWLPMKGIRYLREAAAVLLAEDPELQLVCAGTLAAADAVRAEFPPDVRGRVAVYPRVEPAALAGLYRAADAFVFPSLYEGFSLAIAEAMASRLAIVSTRVGVAGDALRDEQEALIVPKRRADALVAAVRRLRADPALGLRLGNAAAAAAAAYRLPLVEARTAQFFVEAAGGTR